MIKKLFLNLKLSNYIIFSISLFAIIFFISLIFFIIEKGGIEKKVLFFPGEFEGKLYGEERYVKKQNKLELDIKYLIKELLLGPKKLDLALVLPKHTKLISLFLINRILYINFSKELIISEEKMPLNLIDMLQACINTIKYNFSGIRDIYFFINGEKINYEENKSLYEKNTHQNRKARFSNKLLK